MTSSFIHPALILIFGALILPFIRDPFRKIYLVTVPILTFLDVIYLNMHPGMHGVVSFMNDWTLTFGRVDNLSMVFGFIMALMAIIGTIYGLHVNDNWQHMAAWFYVAGSIGVIYCGDYLVLFLFWEMMAFASTFLVWFNKEKGALAAGYRYLLVHTFGGVLLLLGFVLRYQVTGDLSFVHLSEQNSQLYTWLILAGLMLNAAVPPLHSWLPDAYSKATVTGAVFMCAFTTKTAIYTLARAFAGFDILIVLGVIMAIYGIVYAIMENDIRRLLGWEIVSQVGYMVTGVGIGTALAINGTCAHAFAHILYKGLLFMAAGAVVQATGKTKLTELGGLYKKMPSTLVFMVVGGISVSAFPFFSGFVTKSMIVTASFEAHLLPVGFLLTLVSVGTFLVAGLRLPYYVFFGESRCDAATFNRAEDPPWNMHLAMLISALLCFFIGSYTPFLYNMLPNPEVAYHPYGSYHLSETLQLLAFTGVAFYFLKELIAPRATISLDLDWFYRIGGRGFLWLATYPIQWFDNVWGVIYRVVGLNCLMSSAKFWSWFDWHGIDGVVDGSARCVRALGRRVTLVLQKGQIQQTLYVTVTFAAILLASFVLL
ncbi:Na(+)/H(+) antiporter subunit D [Desulforhopalus singaporensis]|uniref:Multisubunit sodium/proton antiporter, MrpD subunit n=1 Tax=Desulforhopalus singaporensis TaxID=91360 RepID=A0A1H0V4G2_9BACT|nr:Na(+)/H(+) antiporter subunit D [Desulforhopalus singaporensis]SDP73412.1 multisubunit sodium/proton antiporter, MrpD subunit [Desulforhopalus singaporensis]